ncbi:hypothetical protein [Paraburkholderia flava]|uniref:hypothetical protein n=1 Tax=Paraburkholderia flava TaxID=2547393 RepID=UPI00105E944F|nr:hypothetical protein [Paraburkholderia flava]
MKERAFSSACSVVLLHLSEKISESGRVFISGCSVWFCNEMNLCYFVSIGRPGSGGIVLFENKSPVSFKRLNETSVYELTGDGNVA